MKPMKIVGIVAAVGAILMGLTDIVWELSYVIMQTLLENGTMDVDTFIGITRITSPISSLAVIVCMLLMIPFYIKACMSMRGMSAFAVIAALGWLLNSIRIVTSYILPLLLNNYLLMDYSYPLGAVIINILLVISACMILSYFVKYLISMPNGKIALPTIVTMGLWTLLCFISTILAICDVNTPGFYRFVTIVVYVIMCFLMGVYYIQASNYQPQENE